MRIYSRKEFMKLPIGTIFSSGSPFAFSDIYLKGETGGIDFLQSSLVTIDPFCSEENADRFYEMLEKRTSYPINKSEGREGLFDDEMLYFVYEKDDLEYMIKCFKNAIQVCK